MKIYTKTGDAGTTSLVGGTRVSKTHPRVMAYGDADELISHLGLLRCHCAGGNDELSHAGETLRRIQEDLMQISAHFAADRKQAKLKPLTTDMVDFLESEIDRRTPCCLSRRPLCCPQDRLPPPNATLRALSAAVRNAAPCS